MKRFSLDARRVTTLCLAVMIVCGVVLRLRAIGWPSVYAFDEEPFADNARNYLLGLPDTNDHPPLGKLLISIGILIFGYDSVGWRFTAVCFGLFAIVIAGMLGKATFDRARAGWIAAAFVAADGFFLAYSRAGLLDGILTCLVLWTVLAAVRARSWQGALISAFLAGLAASVKWSGGLAVIPAAAAILLLGRAPRRAVACFAIAPLVHVLVWMAALRLTEQPWGPGALWSVMTGLFRHHRDLADTANLEASPWYSWLLMVHPIMVKHAKHGLDVIYASSAGNPALFFPVTLTSIGFPLASGIAAIRGRFATWLDPSFTRPALVLALGWLVLILPWTVGRGGYTFYYHYLPSYGFGLVLLAGLVELLERRSPRIVAGFVVIALAMAAWFAPVWAEIPIRERSANRRLLFQLWRP